MTRGEEGAQTSRSLNELCSILLAILRSPQLAIPSSSSASSPVREGFRHASPSVLQRLRLSQASPAAVASLLLGVSMALMLGGSVTFVLGFMLMPWVLGMLTLLYVAGVVSSLSALGRAFLFPSASSAPSAPSAPKEVKGKLLSKLPTERDIL